VGGFCGSLKVIEDLSLALEAKNASGSSKLPMNASPLTPFMTAVWPWGREGVWVGTVIVGLGSATLALSMLSLLSEVGVGVGGLKKT
jgi:hypothetical protein